MGILYVVATPIGNLEDITLRALRVLREADFIFCEDTRVTKKLLFAYKIEKPVSSYHQHSGIQKDEEIRNLLKEGKTICLLSDAGTPGISDPGSALVEKLLKEKEIKIVPVPGSSAVIAALSVSGFEADKFFFAGFPPPKKKRKKFFEFISSFPQTVVFYESPHRIEKTMNELALLIPDREVFLAQELTKKFERFFKGTVREALSSLDPRGEFVVILKGQPEGE